MLNIQQISKSVIAVAEEFDIKRIDLFGSYADGKNTPNSDVDLLVEFKNDSVSLLTIAAVKFRLEEILKTDVDVIHAPIEDGALITPERLVEIYAA